MIPVENMTKAIMSNFQLENSYLQKKKNYKKLIACEGSIR